MNRLSAILKRLLPFAIPLVLLAFAWQNPYYKAAGKTLEEGSKRSLESLAVLEDLHLITKATASVHIPIVSGRFEGASQSLENAMKYLSIASITSVVNLMLLKISHLRVFLYGMLGLFGLALFKKYSTMARKLLWLCLLVNPGLSVFTHAMHWVDEEVQITQKDSLHAELQMIHKDFTKKEKVRKKKVAARKKKQLARDKKRGRDKLTVFQRVGDDIGNGVSNVGMHLEEDFEITGKTIHFAIKKVKTMVINYFTSVLILSFLLPVGYLFLCYQFIKAAFPSQATAATQFLSTNMAKEGIALPKVKRPKEA